MALLLPPLQSLLQILVNYLKAAYLKYKMELRIKDKIVKVDRIENGIPVIKAKAEEIRHPDGRVDVIIRVPCLQIQNKLNEEG